MSALAVLQSQPVDPFAAAAEQFDRLPEFLRGAVALGMTHSDMERELEQRGRELMHTLYQAWLSQQAPAEAEASVVDADGEERTRKRVHTRPLSTVFGTVAVERTGYGAQGKASLHPFDGQLNLPDERYSHELRRRVAEEASKNSFDETVDTVARHTGASIPKRQVEELVVRAAQDFDDFYETRRREAAGTREGTGSVLVVTSDGAGVVLDRQDLRPATRKAAQQQRHKLGTRLSKGEKRHRKRMATVAAVYTVAPYVRTPDQVFRDLARMPPGEEREPRPRPESKRVAASLEQEPEQVLEEAFQDALDRDPKRDKTWVSVVDGNKPQLAILEKLAKKHGVDLTIVLDVIHVLDYVWKAGRAFAAESSDELEPWVLERLHKILQGQVSQVAAGMRRSATKRELSKNKREPVDRCANYLLKYKHYLAYDRYLAAGLPIGSGAVEGTVRHLVKDRMALTGARWRLTGAEAVLRLRALRSSQDFNEYWHFHEAQEHERNHRCRYADEKVPTTHTPPDPSRPPRLKVVKSK